VAAEATKRVPALGLEPLPLSARIPGRRARAPKMPLGYRCRSGRPSPIGHLLLLRASGGSPGAGVCIVPKQKRRS
jgi:hypothetical protein